MFVYSYLELMAEQEHEGELRRTVAAMQAQRSARAEARRADEESNNQARALKAAAIRERLDKDFA